MACWHHNEPVVDCSPDILDIVLLMQHSNQIPEELKSFAYASSIAALKVSLEQALQSMYSLSSK